MGKPASTPAIRDIVETAPRVAGGILILSTASSEATTNRVMEHLLSLGIAPLRLNGRDLDQHSDFQLALSHGTTEIEIEGVRFDPREVRAVWFRRWLEPQPFQGMNLLPSAASDSYAISQRVTDHLLGELRRLGPLVFSELEELRWLGHPNSSSPNKLRVLKLASQVGLETPATIVTTSKEHLRRFAAGKRIVTKPIGEADSFPVGRDVYLMFTREISDEVVESLPDRFFPSLFQERIEKLYELRTFYLAGDCHSAAIFSQADPGTSDDFRNYNRQRPNRMVAYRLPQQIEDRIGQLMKRLQLDTGSLDLIRTPDGRFVFLEVNPVGQFGMISRPCNYHLEKKVALHLARMASDAATR